VFACHLIAFNLNVTRSLRRVPGPVLGAALAGVLLLCQLLMPEDVKAFIYFQF
jgi:hypothetical protein